VPEKVAENQAYTCPYSLTEVFGRDHLLNVPHQKGVRWLTEIFSRSAEKFPDLTALQIPCSGESLSFAELDARAEKVAAALSPFVTGPDQVVAVAMSQDNWQIVAAHLGILKAGGAVLLLDTTLPDALVTHMLNDAQPVVVLTRGQAKFRDLPALDVTALPESTGPRAAPTWLDDPTQRLATIFYTSGTTGMPKGVECPHAGYVNLALSYADYFDLLPGMDATSLTSSLGYDGSISEMYSAWVSGCAVVMLTKEQLRAGPDLVPVLREAEVTVLFCPPVLLTTLTATPEVDLPYPLCRYIVPAGEAFPSALVEPWTRGRRQVINTYGPTEASTDTSRQSLRPGEPVTIGSPFPNVTYVILEVDGLRPLPHSEAGELCIGGVHVARGYRNLPEQTAEKFIMHAELGRLYRTGDKCKIDIQTQRVHFLGRIDTQIKVRGHRVEIQAVEDILQTQFPEIEAAVLDYQNEMLVAFVAAPSVHKGGISVVAPAPADWAAHVTGMLARRLPPASVPTKMFLVEKFVMKPVSGKIDRERLPRLSELRSNAELEAEYRPDGVRERREAQVNPHDDVGMTPECREVLAICRTVFETPLGLDDGFVEAGGHSILIARLAHQLQAAGWAVPVRALLSDCNTARKVASRPRALEQSPGAAASGVNLDESSPRIDHAAAEVLPIEYFTTLQVLFAMLLYSPPLAGLLIGLSFVEVGTFFTTASLWEFIAAGFFVYLIGLFTPFASLLWVMIMKLLLGGAIYKNNVIPGVYPKWSRMHLRVWCIGRLESMVLVTLRLIYRSAPLMAFVLRQLGATVGKNLQCAQDAQLSGPLDLISIDDDVGIQTGAYIQTTRWLGQHLHVGPVHLNSGCKIGMRAGIGSNVTVGRGSWITPFTPILDNVGSQEIWEGAPARLSGRCTELTRTARVCEHAAPVWLLETANILMQILVSFWIYVVPTAVILWFATGLLPVGDADLSAEYFRATPPFEIVWHLSLYAFIATGLTVIITSVLSCLLVRCTAGSAGLYATHGLRGALLLYRVHLMNRVQRQWTWTITGQYLRALSGMRFPRPGASECDLMFNLVPELATADAQVFWSNGCFTNMLDYGAEHCKLRQLDMPAEFFSGNNCVAEYGHFPSSFTLGVSSPASDIQFRRQMWSRRGAPLVVAGNPPVKFATASVPDEKGGSSRPPFLLFLIRIVLFDVFGISILPIAEGLIFTILYICWLRLGEQAIASAIIALALTEAALVLFCIAIKKSLVGKWGSNHSAPFWSWRHFAYFFAQDCFFVWCRGALGFCAGTVLSNSVLRRMGCLIGRRTILTQPMQCSDWNAVSVGDDCILDGVLQFHSFENMVLRVKRTQIEDGSAVGFGATLMGGAVIARHTTLMPLSLVLKEMRLPTATYEGSPAQPVDAANSTRGLDVAPRSKSVPKAVDNTDWLKTVAILLVLVDHFGHFFMEDDTWWAVFGRFAAPPFFFLMGYAETRAVPRHWLWLGITLTLLNSWNAGWSWVAPNILLSLALIRVARPHLKVLLQRYGWAAFSLLICALVALLGPAGAIVDYGAEGWLWALFGFCQRKYVDDRSATKPGGAAQPSPPLTPAIGRDVGLRDVGLMRLVACVVAAVVYVWQEQKEFSFPAIPLAVLVVGAGVLSVGLSLFLRGPSRIQPPLSLAGVLRFIGRHTLEIYAIQLAGSELLIKLVPDIAP
jgi:non-ribosomal peptide synthetase-like protein